MYIKDYTIENNKLNINELKTYNLYIHDEEVKNRLNTFTSEESLGKVLGNLCNLNEYIDVVNYKNTPKKFDMIINDKNKKKVIIELPFDLNKKKIKIIEEKLTREYKFNDNNDTWDLELSAIEFKNKNNSFKISNLVSNSTFLFKINNYLGVLNLVSKEDTYNDEEIIKDLILNQEEDINIDELYLKIKDNINISYDKIQILYKKTLEDLNKKADEISETNGVIDKFLITKDDKQYDLTNSINMENLRTKK